MVAAERPEQIRAYSVLFDTIKESNRVYFFAVFVELLNLSISTVILAFVESVIKPFSLNVLLK